VARPTVRTRTLLADHSARIKELFGTIPNAYKCLRLEGRLPYNVFYRALQWFPVKPEEAEQITAHWEAWSRRFLAVALDDLDGFRLPDEDTPSSVFPPSD
jgi:hypothetical protein